MSWAGFVINDQDDRDFGVVYPDIVMPPFTIQAEDVWGPRVLTEAQFEGDVPVGPGVLDTPSGQIWQNIDGSSATANAAYLLDGSSFVYTDTTNQIQYLLTSQPPIGSIEVLTQFSIQRLTGTTYNQQFGVHL